MITNDHSELTISAVELLNRMWLRKLFPGGLDHSQIVTFYANSPLEYQRIFVEQMGVYLEKGQGNIDFALEWAAKKTTEKFLKSCFDLRRKYPDQFEKGLDDLAESVDYLIRDMVSMYTKPGKFGRFIIDVLNSLPNIGSRGDELHSVLEKLEFMLEYKLRDDAEWKKQDHMSHDFFLGYLLGMASPAIDGIKTWDSMAPYYPTIVGQIKSSVQSKHGKNRWGEWPDGMRKWLQIKMINEPKRTTKNQLVWLPQIRSSQKKLLKRLWNIRNPLMVISGIVRIVP